MYIVIKQYKTMEDIYLTILRMSMYVVVGLLMESILYRFDTENKIDSDNKLSRIFIILLWPLWIVMFLIGFIAGMIKEITKLFK